MTETWDTPLTEEPKRRRGKLTVCRCGHAESWHTVVALGALCNGGRGTCGCAEWTPVARVDDARDFTFGVRPDAPGHPLLMGVRKTVTKGRTVEWITEDGNPPRCDLWGCTDPSVTAVMLSGKTVMFCINHTKGETK